MCDRCAQLEQMLSDSQESERLMADEVEALRRKIGQSARAELALSRKLNEVREDDPMSADIKRVLKDWREKTGHPRANIDVTGVRAEKVRLRLKHGFTVEDLLKANVGAGRFPYVVNAQRRAQGDKQQRFDDAELIFRNEKTVEKFIELADLDDPGSGVQAGKPNGPLPPMVTELRRARKSRPVSNILDALEQIGAAVQPELALSGSQRWTTVCPLDRGVLHVREMQNGTVFLNCDGGCPEDGIMDALGLGCAELFPVYGKRAA